MWTVPVCLEFVFMRRDTVERLKQEVVTDLCSLGKKKITGILAVGNETRSGGTFIFNGVVLIFTTSQRASGTGRER